MQEADMGFVLIIDRRNDKWSSVKTTLLKISVSFVVFCQINVCIFILCKLKQYIQLFHIMQITEGPYSVKIGNWQFIKKNW